MPTSMMVPDAYREKVEHVAAKHELDISFVAAPPCDLAVEESPERGECGDGLIRAEGWIRCQVAWHMAGAADIPLRAFGDLLHALNVKIRECSLGCFP